MKRFLLTFLVLATLSKVAFGVSTKEVPELEKCFKDKGVVGTFVLFDAESDTMLVWNEARAKQRFIPASTFKIANSLIGLEVGAVENVDEKLPYGGKPQQFKQWERDMSLRE